MKVKIAVMVVILGLIYALQLCWVKIVVVFLHILESMSCEFNDLFLCVMFVPVVEETLYRHLPLSVGKHYFPKSIIAIALGSSIIFGLQHGNGFVANILIQGCIGLSFAWVYLNFGLKYSILSHALWNLGCYLNFV
jgi:hypothetical protein